MFAGAEATRGLWPRCRLPLEPHVPEVELERRDFFKLAGGGLLLLLALDGNASAQAAVQGDARPPELAAWLHIDADGTIIVYTGKTEVGQNIRTSLAQAVAEELRGPHAAVH